MADPKFDVFLCHNSEDKPQVIEIAQQLKAHSLKPWLDMWELRPGLPWQRELERQIRSIKAAAVFIGGSGLGPWQEMELEAYLREFVNRECPVIPVLLSSTPQVPKLPVFLAGNTWVDFRARQPDPMQLLIWGITGVRPSQDNKNPTQPPDNDIPLISDQGVDYTKLRNLLTASNWRGADQETIKVMLQAASVKSSRFSSADFSKMPCPDLKIIDQLWNKFSRGKFGFSVQARIYREQAREDYYDFSTRVGWRVQGRWLGYNDLTWNPDKAPAGHLPHMQGRMLYPATEQSADFHLNSWGLDLGDRVFGGLESIGLMEAPLISSLAQRAAQCQLFS